MQNEAIFSEILTKDDLREISAELNLLEAGLYETKGNTFEFVLANSVSKSLSDLISNQIKTKDKKTVLEDLKQALNEIKFVELTVAIELSQSFLEKITTWLRAEVKQKVALDIKIDPSIIGGIKLSFEGKYLDLSLKTKLNNILINYV